MLCLLHMKAYQTKASTISLKRYGDIKKETFRRFNLIKKRTKRKPYIRSAYFNKQKIFFDYFWSHIFQKSPKERVKRLQYFSAAIDLLKNSKNDPVSQDNPHKSNETLHRFLCATKEKNLFCVQVEENKRTGNKYFMSCFSME